MQIGEGIEIKENNLKKEGVLSGMMKYNILYHSHYPWSNVMSRYTNLAIALSKSSYINKIVFLEPLRRIGDINRKKVVRKIFQIGRYHKIKDNPFSIYSAIMPIPFRRFNVSEKFNNIWSNYTINKLECLIPSDNRILFLQGPNEYTLKMIKIFKKKGWLTIFDWANLYEEHVGDNPKKKASICREISSIADIVLCVSPQILNLALPVNKNSILHPNAFPKEMIIKKVNPPRSIAVRKKNPTICYFGLINPIKLDCSLICEIAKKKKEWQFLLIGPQSDPTNIGIQLNGDNISVLPPVNGNTLHKIIRERADLCYIPYNLSDKAVFACSPLKLYEAFGDGLPIVTTDTFDPLDAKEMISVGNTAAEMIKSMEYELRTDSIEKREKRIEYAKKNIWEKRVNQLFSIISSLQYYN